MQVSRHSWGLVLAMMLALALATAVMLALVLARVKSNIQCDSSLARADEPNLMIH